MDKSLKIRILKCNSIKPLVVNGEKKKKTPDTMLTINRCSLLYNSFLEIKKKITYISTAVFWLHFGNNLLNAKLKGPMGHGPNTLAINSPTVSPGVRAILSFNYGKSLSLSLSRSLSLSLTLYHSLFLSPSLSLLKADIAAYTVYLVVLVMILTILHQ